jgi:hypothetical protein
VVSRVCHVVSFTLLPPLIVTEPLAPSRRGVRHRAGRGEQDLVPALLDPDRKICRVAAPPERDFTTNAVV